MAHRQVVGQAPVVLDLISLLDAKRWEVAIAWAEAIRCGMPDTFYGQRPIEEIRDNNLLAIDALKDLLLGIDVLPSWWIAHFKPIYLQVGPQFKSVVEGILLFKDVLPPLFLLLFPLAPRVDEIMLRLEAYLRRFVALMVEGHAMTFIRHYEQQHRHTALMLKMARAVISSVTLEDVLHQIVRGIADAVGVRHCLIFLLNEERTGGTVWAVTGEFPPAAAERMQKAQEQLYLLEQTSFARRVVETKQPISLYDAQADRSPEDTFDPEIRSVLGVPCLFNDQVLAVVLVFTYDMPRTFSEEQVELTIGIASLAAPAIENARLHQKIEQMAMMEERARLAQEIHDDLAQMLTAIQFRSSLAGDLLTEGQVVQARQRVAEVQDMIRQANMRVRESIFNLRVAASLESDFLATLQQYIAAYRRNYGLDVQLLVDEDAVTRLRKRDGMHIIRIVQEALSNARRHGKATHVWVSIQRDHNSVCVKIEDDGQGFDPSRVEGPDLQHYGLQIMRERAERVSGRLTLESQPGQGTRVVLYLS